MRRGLVPLMAAAFLLLGAAQAAPPDSPVNYIKVDELKGQLDRGARADIIDVRHWPEFEALHIKGARSMPIRSIGERAAKEISKAGVVILY